MARGEFNISGFQSKNLRYRLLGKTSGQISRLLKRLRVHGLHKRIGKTYNYYLTALGNQVCRAQAQRPLHHPRTLRRCRSLRFFARNGTDLFMEALHASRESSDGWIVISSYRTARLTRLRSVQNLDGGWGYFPGKQSWLEPTCYALLALHGDQGSAGAWERGWRLIHSWQMPEGGFRPHAAVSVPTWATALAVTLHAAHGTLDARAERAVQWMLGVKGVEGSWLERIVDAVRKLPVEYDRRWIGWPWLPEASSWVEPTSHCVSALKKVSKTFTHPALGRRIVEGERMLVDRRTSDGGWNYGNRRVLRTDLPSYAETTGVALLGLKDTAFPDRRRTLETALKHAASTRSELGRAWLAIGLRNWGVEIPGPAEGDAPGDDVVLAALQAIGCANGGHQWL